jgi:hypothetical protein
MEREIFYGRTVYKGGMQREMKGVDALGKDNK